MKKRIITVAVFSDIHGNYHAFKACYEDAIKHGAEQFVFLGDYVSDLADSRKTMDLVYEIRECFPTVCLRGNRERYMLEYEQGISSFSRGSKTGSLLYTYDNLRQQDIDFFKGLKMYDTISINGVMIEIAHAAKDDDRCYFEGDDPKIEGIFSEMQASYLLTGHSHRQYIQSQDGKTILNPGSVGIPQGGTRWPAYALLRVEGGAVSFQLRQVLYDITAAIHAQFENGLVEYSHCWGISILHDIITGEEYTIRLLENVYGNGDVCDEEVWRAEAAKMGMKFTEREIIELLSRQEVLNDQVGFL